MTDFKKISFTLLIVLSFFGFAQLPEKILESEQANVINDRVIIHKLDAALLKNKIEEQKKYLLHAKNPQYFGYYKLYDPSTDTAETRLRSVYSASAAFSFLKLKQYEGGQELDQTLAEIADFLFFMQVKEGPLKGAFHYSYDLETNTKEQRYVVGSASKAIFTLVELYRITQNSQYLQAAQDAGHWLIQQVDDEGAVTPEIKFTQNEWKVSKQKSYLYSGQVLTALSRLYAVTHAPELYEPAEKIANELLHAITSFDYFVGDDFREPNTISTSWISLALIDFSKINPKATVYQEAALKAMDQILKHQLLDSSDFLLYGKFDDTNASSGNGWINEVLMETYQFCLDRVQETCGRYLDASIKSTRWLIQNIYSFENTKHLPNPERTRGGLIRDSQEKTVRTDAVCHSLNGMVELLKINPDILFEVA